MACLISVVCITLLTVTGFALFFKVSFQISWDIATKIPLPTAGMTPLNASLAQRSGGNIDYWMQFGSGDIDDTQTTKISPYSKGCISAGSECYSYFLPGGVDATNSTLVFKDGFNEATGFLVEDSVGYQIELYPYPPGDFLIVNNFDCGVYSMPTTGIEICVTQSGSNLVLGKLVCDCLADRCRDGRLSANGRKRRRVHGQHNVADNNCSRNRSGNIPTGFDDYI